MVSPLMLTLPLRYNPDRMLSVVVMILVGICLQLMHDSKVSVKRFSIQSGVLLGVGTIMKFTFLPFTIFPFLVLRRWKDRWRYVCIFFLTAVICLIPIHKRLPQMWVFLRDLLMHDDLYGQGNENAFNLSKMSYHAQLLISHNYGVILLLLISMVGVLFWSIKSKNKPYDWWNTRIMLGIASAVLISAFMVAKHYKNYYIIPSLASVSFIYFLMLQLLSQTNYGILKKIGGLCYFLVVVFGLGQSIQKYKGLEESNAPYWLSEAYVRNHIAPDDYIFVEPGWTASPIPAGALVFGMSYVHHHNQYYNHIMRYYPNILTWEGADRPMMHFRMTETDMASVFKSGRSIYVFDNPDRNAAALMSYIEKHADQQKVEMRMDTVFRNKAIGEHIIRYTHTDHWSTVLDVNCGFEKITDGALFLDDESQVLDGGFQLVKNKVGNGVHALYLDESVPKSPVLTLNTLEVGDYLRIEILRTRTHNKQDKKGTIYLYYLDERGQRVVVDEGAFVGRVGKKWELMRMTKVMSEDDLAHELRVDYIFEGDLGMWIDDLSIRIYRDNSN